MTIEKFTIIVALVALLLTVVMYYRKVELKNWVISYLQNFTGVFFMVSGIVKAVDPLGTAYKMQDYFTEFEATFSGTWISFIAPMFPWFSSHATTVSVVMIVFEIILGLMLIIGAFPKLTSWLFLLLVAFFTVLTGYTYLTAYVPDGVNFFQFSKWGPFVETSMKVTDCGCFGDFMKLKPIVTFSKDIILLIPAFIFLFGHKKMHQLFSKTSRTLWVVLSIVLMTAYAMNNYVWNIPHYDFRPFYEGANIREQKVLEEESESNIEILAYEVTNKETGAHKEIPFDQYMKEFKKYPKEEWDLEQVQSEPTVKRTKVSDFELSDYQGEDVTEALLGEPGYSLFAVAYKLKGTESTKTDVVYDTIYRFDTLYQVAISPAPIEKRIDAINKRQEVVPVYYWDKKETSHWTGAVVPVFKAAKQAGVKTYALTAYADPAKIKDFADEIGADFPFYTGDDIMLKTIVRSNPGVVLMKDGKIIKKWHYKKLPHFEEIKNRYMGE